MYARALNPELAGCIEIVGRLSKKCRGWIEPRGERAAAGKNLSQKNDESGNFFGEKTHLDLSKTGACTSVTRGIGPAWSESLRELANEKSRAELVFKPVIAGQTAGRRAPLALVKRRKEPRRALHDGFGSAVAVLSNGQSLTPAPRPSVSASELQLDGTEGAPGPRSSPKSSADHYPSPRTRS